MQPETLVRWRCETPHCRSTFEAAYPAPIDAPIAHGWRRDMYGVFTCDVCNAVLLQCPMCATKFLYGVPVGDARACSEYCADAYAARSIDKKSAQILSLLRRRLHGESE